MPFPPLALLVVLIVGVIVGTAARNRFLARRRAFNDRFPPISDDEFVRRCGPDVHRDIAIRVRRIVADQLGIEYERVYPEQSFVGDLGCD